MKDYNIKKKLPKKNYENLLANPENANEEVQLMFSLTNARKDCEYSLHLKDPDKDSNDDSLVVDNKKCSDSNTIFFFAYNCEYSFVKEQKLKIELVTKDLNSEKSISFDIIIAEVVGSKNSKKSYPINGNYGEILEVKAEKQEKKTKFLTFHFDLKIVSKKNEPIPKKLEEQYFIKEEYKIYYQIVINKILLYESEVFTDDGKFNIVQIPIELLESGFSIIFFNNKKNKFGKIDTDIQKMINSKESLLFSKQLSLDDKLNIYNYSLIKEKITFLDYIKNGVRIALDIGIDFTGSNGHPDDVISLHCRLPDEETNPYHKAILSCAKIMANYDYDQKFPVYGFGAIIKETNELSMCFNINFQDDPNIQFVENIMLEYYSCLDKIIFSGPTCFAPIINKIIDVIREEDDILEYHVLMILTDGIIDDYDDTVKALVEGSFLPLSVIIIGIGNTDFTMMEKLDGDNDPIMTKDGKKRQRDLVQFVPYNKFKDDEKKLVEEVLDEIPRQIIEYYSLNFIYPENLKKKSDNEVKKSVDQKDNLNESTHKFKDPEEKLFDSKNRNINNSKNYNYSYNNKDYISNNNNNDDSNNNRKSKYFVNIKIKDSNNYNQQLKSDYIPNPFRNPNNNNNNMNNINNNNYMNNNNNINMNNYNINNINMNNQNRMNINNYSIDNSNMNYSDYNNNNIQHNVNYNAPPNNNIQYNGNYNAQPNNNIQHNGNYNAQPNNNYYNQNNEKKFVNTPKK